MNRRIGLAKKDLKLWGRRAGALLGLHMDKVVHVLFFFSNTRRPMQVQTAEVSKPHAGSPPRLP